MPYHFSVILALATLTSLHQITGSPLFNGPLDTFSKREPQMIGLSSYEFDPVMSTDEGHLEEKLFLAQKLYDDILNDINDILDVEESPALFSADPSSASSLPSSEPSEFNGPISSPKPRQPVNKSRRHLWNILSNVNSRFSKD
ncbi:hypothetical protein TCAL_13146 [Tigriopus californicus]|uniref:Uncharacterized protein n=1 Tax=Tigriopus californicus TaxID=6832 RepID=A0A553N8R1_TIGCA|nr:uncharacterized protein LOC131884939 [Tigriopus californicus]TRY61800.1 hypothetical protein TCAL_13146 [Tigriopus californicus]|eukprot:TCALIF_13146-PA protein Name:"Protein of unknown function" AED:0.00 eAED:0.00 QI:80/1/0.66/1/0/0/3/297/142